MVILLDHFNLDEVDPGPRRGPVEDPTRDRLGVKYSLSQPFGALVGWNVWGRTRLQDDESPNHYWCSRGKRFHWSLCPDGRKNF